MLHEEFGRDGIGIHIREQAADRKAKKKSAPKVEKEADNG